MRWAVRALISLVILALVAIGAVFLISDRQLHRSWPIRASSLRVTSTPERVAEGERLATVMGCMDCHGPDLTGRLFFDEPQIARMWAPNLTRLAPGYTDAQLDVLLRQGVRPNGQGILIMPSTAFATLDDNEIAALIAFVRSKAPAGAARPPPAYGMVGRIGLVLGQFATEPATLARGGPGLPDYGPQFAQGRSLARACVECHGANLTGTAQAGAPDLLIGASYSLEELTTLLRTGKSNSGRPLTLMAESAPVRFNVWSDAEIKALHDYLVKRAEMTP